MKSTPPEFPIVFSRLRGILQEHASKFTITSDTADHYCLEIPFSPRFKKRFPVAWAKVSKSYVSLHYMPMYFLPGLQKTLSAKLKARMQGKSCFNFKSVDEELFQELRELVSRGFESSRKAAVL